MRTIQILLLITATCCGVNSFAQTWMPSSAPSNNWASITSSADGTKLAAVSWPGPIYVSTNSGADWILTEAPNGYWNSIACSADGMKLIAASDGPILISTNAGISWIQTSAPSNYWGSVASSSDGEKLVAVAAAGLHGSPPGAKIYTSIDSGNTWTQQTNFSPATYPFPGWTSVASSADGNNLVIVGSQIYYSTNAGVSWTQSATQLDPGGFVSPSQIVASSADGKKWIVGFTSTVSGYSSIFISTNSGTTWTQTSTPSNSWVYIAASSDGNKIIAASWDPNSQPVPLYLSTNFGETWQASSISNTDWAAVALSADGGKMFAAAGSAFNQQSNVIFTAQSISTPILNISPANPALKISWTVPSTNFVLQSSADLSSWTDLTNQPVLNLTNLQNEVALPLSDSNQFYRLKTP